MWWQKSKMAPRSPPQRYVPGVTCSPWVQSGPVAMMGHLPLILSHWVSKRMAGAVKVLNHWTLGWSRGSVSWWAWPNQVSPLKEGEAVKEMLFRWLWEGANCPAVEQPLQRWEWSLVNSLLRNGGKRGLSHTTARKWTCQELEWTWKRPLRKDGANETLISALRDPEQRTQLKHARLLTHRNCDIIRLCCFKLLRLR